MVALDTLRHCSSSVIDFDRLQITESTVDEMQAAVEVLIHGIGEDVSRQGLRDTPRRVAKAWLDMTSHPSTSSAQQSDTSPFGQALFDEPIVHASPDGIVLVRDITFASLSQENLLPFFGKCHVAYVPHQGVILGLSKLARATRHLARRIQSQNRLTADLMAAIQQEVSPRGIAVITQASHIAAPSSKGGIDARGRMPQEARCIAACGCFLDSPNGMLDEVLICLDLHGDEYDNSSTSTGEEDLLGSCDTIAIQSSHHRETNTSSSSSSSSSSSNTNSGNNGYFKVDAVYTHGTTTTSTTPPPATAVTAPSTSTTTTRADMIQATKILLRCANQDTASERLHHSAVSYVDWLLYATAGYSFTFDTIAADAPISSPSSNKTIIQLGPMTPDAHSVESSDDAASDDVIIGESMHHNTSCMSGGVSSSTAGTNTVQKKSDAPSAASPPLSAARKCHDVPHHALHPHLEPPRTMHRMEHRVISCSDAAAVDVYALGFFSQCEHHLLPFYGTFYVAMQRPTCSCINDKKGVESDERGIDDEASTIARIVAAYSRRLQVQERLTHQVAHAVVSLCNTANSCTCDNDGECNVLVVCESAHLCMVARGVEEHCSATVTTATRGGWTTDVRKRKHVLNEIMSMRTRR